jgi:hypothetical protein
MDEEEKEDEEDERLKHDENEGQNGEGSAMGESDEETPPLISAAHKSNKSNPGSYLRYLIASGTGYVV